MTEVLAVVIFLLLYCLGAVIKVEKRTKQQLKNANDTIYNKMMFGLMTTNHIKEAMIIVIRNLKEDAGYRKAWQANIAMAFFDEYNSNNPPLGEHETKTIMKVANKAADNFLNLLTK